MNEKEKGPSEGERESSRCHRNQKGEEFKKGLPPAVSDATRRRKTERAIDFSHSLGQLFRIFPQQILRR